MSINYQQEIMDYVIGQQQAVINLNFDAYTAIFDANWDYLWLKFKQCEGIFLFQIRYNINQLTTTITGVKDYILKFNDLQAYLSTKISDPDYDTLYAPLGNITSYSFVQALAAYIYNKTGMPVSISDAISSVLLIRIIIWSA